jgi:hypothetical protein
MPSIEFFRGPGRDPVLLDDLPGVDSEIVNRVEVVIPEGGEVTLRVTQDGGFTRVFSVGESWPRGGVIDRVSMATGMTMNEVREAIMRSSGG